MKLIIKCISPDCVPSQNVSTVYSDLTFALQLKLLSFQMPLHFFNAEHADIIFV